MCLVEGIVSTVGCLFQQRVLHVKQVCFKMYIDAKVICTNV